MRLSALFALMLCVGCANTRPVVQIERAACTPPAELMACEADPPVPAEAELARWTEEQATVHDLRVWQAGADCRGRLARLAGYLREHCGR